VPSGATKEVESRALVAGLFRPPVMTGPSLGELPKDVAPASSSVPYPMTTSMPPFPPFALESGVVLVEVTVSPAGEVVDAQVLRSAPPFDEPALDAARQWKFRPARPAGVAIASRAYIVFGFRQPVTAPPGRGGRPA
jgi:protein TonB